MFGCPTIFDAKVDLHESSKCLELYLTNSSFWTKKKKKKSRNQKYEANTKDWKPAVSEG